MNEKFFDLAKEKQDRIMSASMQVFAVSGYEHASTDEMVKLARISKGLLFHYFISKKGLYSFLYEYAVRFALLELGRSVGKEETDFFVIQEQILTGWQNAMRQYPYIRFFIQTADKETDNEAALEIGERRKAYRESVKEITQRIGEAFFGSDKMLLEACRIMEDAAASLLQEMDFEDENWQDSYFDGLRTCLEFIGHYRHVRKEDETHE